MTELIVGGWIIFGLVWLVGIGLVCLANWFVSDEDKAAFEAEQYAKARASMQREWKPSEDAEMRT